MVLVVLLSSEVLHLGKLLEILEVLVVLELGHLPFHLHANEILRPLRLLHRHIEHLPSLLASFPGVITQLLSFAVDELADAYAREYREIAQGHFGKRNEGHDAAPRDLVVSDVPVRILFAPDHSPEMEIMKQMLKATKRIDFAIFTFSKSSGIDDTMLTLLELGRPIRGAFDATQGGQDWAAIPNLTAAGAKLFKVRAGGGIGKLHHKLMVLDEQVVIAGSFNYTGPANRLNDENIIILGDLQTTSAASKAAQSKIAKFALKEIERIITTHGEPAV